MDDAAQNIQSFPWEREPKARYPVKDSSQRTEFELKYPPDGFGEEATDSARVWGVYRNRAMEQDEDRLGRWHKTIDVLLVFAGLFSAVCTAFVIEGKNQLQPDYTALLARAFIASQLNSSSSSPDYDVSNFKPSAAARWYNGLWVASLTLSLVVALLAILAKQWLEEYSSRMRSPSKSLFFWASRRILFSNGLMHWRMGAFVAALPLLLHVSLFAFLVGLILFFTELNIAIASVLSVTTAAMLAFWLATLLLPLWNGTCPTITPAVRCLHRAMVSAYTLWAPKSPRDMRAPWSMDRLSEEYKCKVNALVWMAQCLPTTAEANVALDAIGGLDPARERPNLDVRKLLVESQPLLDRYRALQIAGGNAEGAAVGKFLRTVLLLDRPLFSRNSKYRRGYHRALARWSTLSTCDVSFTAKWLLVEAGRIAEAPLVEDLAQWYLSLLSVSPLENARPCLPSTLRLLCGRSIRREYSNTQSLVRLYHLVGFLCCEVLHFRFESNRFGFVGGPTRHLLKAIDHMSEHCSFERSAPQPRARFTPMDEEEDTKLRIMHLLGFLTKYPKPCAGLGQTMTVIQHAFGSVLVSNGRRRLIVPMYVLDQVVPFIDSPSFAARTWASWELDRLAFLLRKVIRTSCGLRRTIWSEPLRNATSRLLASVPSDEPTHAQKAFLLQESSPPVDLAASRTDILRQCVAVWDLHCSKIATTIVTNYASARDLRLNSRVNMLLVPMTQDKPSISLWACIRDAFTPEQLAPFVRELCVVLCALKRHGEDVTLEIGALMGDGMDIALLQTPRGHWYHIMRHAKEAAPEWWQQLSTRILAEEALARRRKPSRRSLLARRIIRIAGTKPCRICPGTLAFKDDNVTQVQAEPVIRVQQEPDPHATDLTPPDPDVEKRSAVVSHQSALDGAPQVPSQGATQSRFLGVVARAARALCGLASSPAGDAEPGQIV